MIPPGRRKLSLRMVVAFWFISVYSAFALNPHRTISQYGHSFWIRENGLPANNVSAILQTRDGSIWLGTTSGLFKFDGITFEATTVDTGKNQGQESISALLETKEGSLWVGTKYNGLRRLKRGKVYIYGEKEGFNGPEVKNLFETHDGHLLVGTSTGLFVFEDKKFKQILTNQNFVTGTVEDSFGRIWVATYAGVKIFNNTKFSNVRTVTQKDSQPFDVTTCIYADHGGRIWIGSFSGLVCLKEGYVTALKMNYGQLYTCINTILEDRDGNIWVGTQKGLYRFSDNKWTAYKSSDGLTNNNAIALSEDREGSIWVGTADGLNQLKDVSITTYTKSDGLDDDVITNLAQTRDGSLFFGSNEGGSITRLKDGNITIYHIPVGPAYVAHDGTLWIGHNGSLFNFRDGKLIRYGTKEGLPQKWVSAISEDSKSLFMNFEGIGVFRFIHGRAEPYLLSDGSVFPINHIYITCFYQQSDTVLWVGTYEYLAKVQNGKTTRYTTSDGLAGNLANSIFDDGEGKLWLASLQGGITLYRNGKFTPYSTNAGLFNNQIYSIVGDDYGNLWLSSPKGIGCVSKQELEDYADGKIKFIHTRVYSTADGMKTDECYGDEQPAGWKSKDGSIWFATRKGAVKIDPRGFRKNELQPPVLIEDVVADQKSIPPDEFISFSPGTNKIEFHYEGLSFLVPQRVLFKYKLEGYDQEWVDAETRRAAYYTNLPPGKYKFRVIACNNDGVWNETGATFSFEIKPHFYETSWFSAILLLVVGGGAFGIYRLRVWQLLERGKKLDTRIQEALAHIKVLGGLIPICANCKKIRDDKGYWENLENYIQTHSEAQFSHGICPDCHAKLYPDFPRENHASNQNTSRPDP